MKSSSNKIRSYRVYSASSKLDRPISDATHTLSEISFIVLRIQTESGITGESYLLSFQYSPNAIRGALKDLLPLIQGFEVSDMGKMSTLLDGTSEYFGMTGINRWVQGLVNIAMWDAWARVFNQPVHHVMGVHKDRIRLYGSGGWLSYTIEELRRETSGYIARGFRSVKIKVGSPDWRVDVARIKAVREWVGPEIDIMMDANQGMDVAGASRLADAVAEWGVVCFEEPLSNVNFQGYRAIKEQTGIPLAMGEREYDVVALRELIRLQAIDIWQPDILRIGGVDAWRASASLAEAYHIPVLPHYYKDYDVPLLCTIANGAGAESFDWVDRIIDNPLTVENGYASPRTGAGWGFKFLDRHLTEINL